MPARAIVRWDPEGTGNAYDRAARAWADFKRLAELNLGKFPEQDKPMDPAPNGPLGPL